MVSFEEEQHLFGTVGADAKLAERLVKRIDSQAANSQAQVVCARPTVAEELHINLDSCELVR